MKRIAITILITLFVVFGATFTNRAAQSGCALRITPVSEEDHTIYEISAAGLPSGAEVTVEAKNKQTRQTQFFSMELESGQTGFSQIFIGKDSNDELIPVSAGKWKVKLVAFSTNSKCQVKTKFRVKFKSEFDNTPPGVWGGRSALLDISTTGGTVEFDCAHGTLNQPLILDDSGRFDVAGTFVREHPGPVRQDEPPDIHPARYTGWTDGKALVVMVELTDSKEMFGPFYLELGKAPRLIKCL